MLHHSVYPGFVALEDLALHLKAIFRDIGKRLDPYFAGFGDAALVVHRSGKASDAALAPVASLSVVIVNEADVISLHSTPSRPAISSSIRRRLPAMPLPLVPSIRTTERCLRHTRSPWICRVERSWVIWMIRCCIRAYVTRAW